MKAEQIRTTRARIKYLRWYIKSRRFVYRNPKKVMFGSVLLLWLFCLLVMLNLFEGENRWASRGQLGDMFGAVNALFSGLAFGGIIITILLQKEELKLQRKELRDTRKVFENQSGTLSVQRFENTFFKLLDLHKEVINEVTLSSSF